MQTVAVNLLISKQKYFEHLRYCNVTRFMCYPVCMYDLYVAGLIFDLHSM